MDSIQDSTMDMGVPVMRIQTQHGTPKKGPPFQNPNAQQNSDSVAVKAVQNSDGVAKKAPHLDGVAKKAPQNSDVVAKNATQNSDIVAKNATPNSDGVAKKAPHLDGVAKKAPQNSDGVAKNAAQNSDSTAKKAPKNLDVVAKKALQNSGSVTKKASRNSDAVAKKTPQNLDGVAKKAPQNSGSVTKNASRNSDAVARNTPQNLDAITKKAPQNSDVVAKNASKNSDCVAKNAQKNYVNRDTSLNTQQQEEPVQAHLVNRSPRNRKPRWQKKKEQEELDNNCKVTVSGYPEYTQPQDLEHLFSQFGKVQVQGKNIEAAILTFSNIAEAYEALKSSKKIALYAEILTVTPYSPSDPKHHTQKQTFERSQQKSVIVSPSSLNLSGDFLQQLDTVVSAVRLSLQEVTGLGQLYSDLENALQAQWPGCKAIPFGSIPTGLGIKTSDADCFMLIPAQFRNQHNMFVSKTRRLLQMYPSVFAEILAIPRANTPIVKFFHIPTETNCDVSFKTPLGTRNSALVFFLLSADPRLIPMAIVIKYWAKVHGLSGTGKLTNYALTMMIIFYLQQPPWSILPSIVWLQKDPTTTNIVDNWNTGFMNKHENLLRSTNTYSMSELIGGFFQYYSSFNFVEMVVCPYLGTPIPKTTFKNTEDLPPEFQRYQQNLADHLAPPLRFLTPMVVQDPLEQCHNVASPITSLMSEKIKVFIDYAAKAYETEKPNNCENFLSKILLGKPKFVEKKPPPDYRIKLYTKMLSGVDDANLKPIVKDIVFDVFEKMCKLKLTKVEQTDAKMPHPRESKKEKEKYSTTITKPLWIRKEFSRVCDFLKLSTIIEKQSRITEEIIRTVPENLNLQIHVTIIYYYFHKSASVTIRMIEGDEVDSYKEFGRFFLVAIQGWIRDLLKPYDKNPKATVPATEPHSTIQHEENGDKSSLDTDDDEDEVLDESHLKNDEQSGNNDTAQKIDNDNNSSENNDS